MEFKLNYSFPGGPMFALIEMTFISIVMMFVYVISVDYVPIADLVFVLSFADIIAIALYVFIVGERLRFLLLPLGSLLLSLLITGGYFYLTGFIGWNYDEFKIKVLPEIALLYPYFWILTIAIYLLLPVKWHEAIFKTVTLFERSEE